MKNLNLLASTSTGRILLHSICILRDPKHFAWHWQGILRELCFPRPCAFQRAASRRYLTVGLPVVVLALLTLRLAAQSQPASTTSISFQGVLNGANGQPLPTGTYSLAFRLYDSPSGGNIIGAPSTNNAVQISAGVASTTIPVNPAWFNGASRYLSVAVNGGLEWSPRMLVTAVPYASFSQATRGVTVDTSGQVGIGTTSPTAPLEVQVAAGQSLRFVQDAWAPGISAVNTMNPDPAAQGTLRLRDALEIWPSTDASRAGRFDVRRTNGIAVVSAYTDSYFGRGVLDICNGAGQSVIHLYGSTTPGVAGGPAGDTAIWTSGHIEARDIGANVVTADTFLNSSDRSLKTNISNVITAEILEKVSTLPVYTWSFTNELGAFHIGPMAQDFYETFRLGTDDKHIATIDEGGVALAAIQGLDRLLQERESDIARLTAQYEAMNEELRRMRFQVNSLVEKAAHVDSTRGPDPEQQN